MKKAYIAIAVLILLGASMNSYYGSLTRTAIDDRIKYWRAIMATEIPIGSSKDRILAWAKQRSLSTTLYQDGESVTIQVEQIPDRGFAFPCSESILFIKIKFKPLYPNSFKAEGISVEQKEQVIRVCI